MRSIMERLRSELVATPQGDWSAVERWAAGARPVIAKHASEQLGQFDELTKPKWMFLPRFSGPSGDNFDEAGRAEEETNRGIGNRAREGLIKFMDTMVELSDPPAAPGEGEGANHLAQVRVLCYRFHAIARQLRSRHSARPTLDIGDEYDVQDLLHALLWIYFDDIRDEEWVPSYAGSSSRTDFLLYGTGIVIEVKKTRSGLGQREVADQLIIDTARYAKHPECRVLVCFVYDPDGRIASPAALEGDLSGKKDKLQVEVIVAPKPY